MKTNLLKLPVRDLLFKNPLVVNYKKMWPFVKPYWFRAVLGLVLAFRWARWMLRWLCL